ncbi:hypothetical protein LZ31DRAFT_552698 [Colletotrichum somersetense]|nr:hypothetical protein LZ31DRAFT_552698 [Colletotrichum somersetense]
MAPLSTHCPLHCFCRKTPKSHDILGCFQSTSLFFWYNGCKYLPIWLLPSLRDLVPLPRLPAAPSISPRPRPAYGYLQHSHADPPTQTYTGAFRALENCNRSSKTMQSAHRNVKKCKRRCFECSRLSRVGGIPAFLRLTLLFTPDKCDALRNQPGPTVTPYWGQEYARSRGNYNTTAASTLPPMPCCLIKRPLLRGLCLARRCQENQLSGTHQAACRSRLLPYLSVLDFG